MFMCVCFCEFMCMMCVQGSVKARMSIRPPGTQVRKVLSHHVGVEN